MSKNNGVLDVPIKKIWFDKIKSGEKKHEYRRVCSHWVNAIGARPFRLNEVNKYREVNKIRLRCGQTAKSTDKEKTMLFEIKSISYINGITTDLKVDDMVFDIKLGKRLE